MRPNRWLSVGITLVIGTVGTGWAQETPDGPDFLAEIGEDDVMLPIEMLASTIGARPVGSDAEREAAEYVADAWAAMGYAVEIQPFQVGRVTSQNVIATQAGRAPGMVVIGAHLDSVAVGTGADDNASGVAVLLAAADALAGWETEYTLVFVAFGAEEQGGRSGSEVYVESLGDAIDDVIAMINVDTVGAGGQLNVYAGAVIESDLASDDEPVFTPGPVWVRDLALDRADDLGIALGTTPPESWDGFTGDWSDHYPFVLAGVPIAYVEAWLWTDTGNPWWGHETPNGDILHTPRDVIANVNPRTVEQAAEVVAATAYAIATEAAP